MSTHYHAMTLPFAGIPVELDVEFKVDRWGSPGNGWDDPGECWEFHVVAVHAVHSGINLTWPIDQLTGEQDEAIEAAIHAEEDRYQRDMEQDFD